MPADWENWLTTPAPTTGGHEIFTRVAFNAGDIVVLGPVDNARAARTNVKQLVRASLIPDDAFLTFHDATYIDTRSIYHWGRRADPTDETSGQETPHERLPLWYFINHESAYPNTAWERRVVSVGDSAPRKMPVLVAQRALPMYTKVSYYYQRHPFAWCKQPFCKGCFKIHADFTPAEFDQALGDDESGQVLGDDVDLSKQAFVLVA